MSDRRFHTTLVALLLLLMTACASGPSNSATATSSGGSSASSAPPERKSIALSVVSVDPAFLPLYVGVIDGTFDKAGLDIKLTVANSGSAVLQAVVAGAADIGAGQADSVAVSAAANAPPSIGVAVMNEGIPLALTFRKGWLEQKGVSPDKLKQMSPNDQLQLLKGAKIATFGPRGAVDNMISELLKVGNLKDGDITRVTIPGPPPQMAALKAGQVDAVVLGPPIVYQGEAQGYAVVGRFMPDFADALRTMPFEAIFTSKKWADANTDTLRRFGKSFAVACQTTKKAEPAKLAQTLQGSEYFKSFDLQHLTAAVEKAREYVPDNCKFSDKGLQSLKDFSVRHGIIKDSLDLSKLYTNDYLK
jgi:NitT/TauT family transport system substrate-binding protein